MKNTFNNLMKDEVLRPRRQLPRRSEKVTHVWYTMTW